MPLSAESYPLPDLDAGINACSAAANLCRISLHLQQNSLHASSSSLTRIAFKPGGPSFAEKRASVLAFRSKDGIQTPRGGAGLQRGPHLRADLARDGVVGLR